MRKLIVALLLGTVCLGCGGSGSTTASPFAGAFAGPFVAPGQSGNALVTIGTNGSVTGSINNTTLGISGTVSGTINNSGNVSGTVLYPGQTSTVTGTLSFSIAGHLVGNLQQNTGGSVLAVAFDLTRV